MPDFSKQLSTLSEVRSGQSFESVVTAARINAIQSLLRALVRGDNITSGMSIRKTDMGNGGVILSSTATGSGGGGDTTITHPFQIADVSDPAADPLVPTIHVRYGTVMDIVPANVDVDFTGDLADNSTNTIYLEAVLLEDGTIDDVTMYAAASQPPDEDYLACITLGTVVIASGVITTINQAATHSLRFATCGRVVVDEVMTVRGSYEFRGF